MHFIFLFFLCLRKSRLKGRRNSGTKHWLMLIIDKIVVLQVTSLLDHLIQLSKAGFSKATQRLDGIYALFAVLRLAAVDTKAGFLQFLIFIQMQVYA